MDYAPTMNKIIESLSSTAEWRREKAEQYPNDFRNQEAAVMIDTLCAELHSIGKCIEYKNLIEHYASLEDDEFYKQIEEENEYKSGLGFRTYAINARDYLAKIRKCAE